MRALFILLFLTSTSSFAFDVKRCQEFSNDCEYYSCVSEAKHCESYSYPLQFGKRYCLRFTDRLKNFSARGKMWVEEVRKCLIHNMSTYEEDVTCGQIRRKAFRDHVPCYVESGFCNLSLRDKRLIIKTALPALKNRFVIRDGLKILKACALR